MYSTKEIHNITKFSTNNSLEKRDVTDKKIHNYVNISVDKSCNVSPNSQKIHESTQTENLRQCRTLEKLKKVHTKMSICTNHNPDVCKILNTISQKFMADSTGFVKDENFSTFAHLKRPTGLEAQGNLSGLQSAPEVTSQVETDCDTLTVSSMLLPSPVIQTVEEVVGESSKDSEKWCQPLLASNPTLSDDVLPNNEASEPIVCTTENSKIIVEHSYSTGIVEATSPHFKKEGESGEAVPVKSYHSQISPPGLVKKPIDIMMHKDKINILRQMSQIFNEEQPSVSEDVSSASEDECQDKGPVSEAISLENHSESACLKPISFKVDSYRANTPKVGAPLNVVSSTIKKQRSLDSLVSKDFDDADGQDTFRNSESICLAPDTSKNSAIQPVREAHDSDSINKLNDNALSCVNKSNSDVVSCDVDCVSSNASKVISEDLPDSSLEETDSTKVHHVSSYYRRAQEKITVKSYVSRNGAHIDIIDGFTFVSCEDEESLLKDLEIPSRPSIKKSKKGKHLSKKLKVLQKEVNEDQLIITDSKKLDLAKEKENLGDEPKPSSDDSDKLKESSGLTPNSSLVTVNCKQELSGNSSAFASKDLENFLIKNSQLNISYDIPSCKRTEEGVSKICESSSLTLPKVQITFPTSTIHAVNTSCNSNVSSPSKALVKSSIKNSNDYCRDGSFLKPKQRVVSVQNKGPVGSDVFVYRAGKLVPLNSVIKKKETVVALHTTSDSADLIYVYDNGKLLILGGSVSQVNLFKSKTVKARVVLPVGFTAPSSQLSGKIVGNSVQAVFIDEKMARFALTALRKPVQISSKINSFQQPNGQRLVQNKYKSMSQSNGSLSQATKSNILDIISAKLALSNPDSSSNDMKQVHDCDKNKSEASRNSKLFKRNLHRFPSLSREMRRLDMNFISIDTSKEDIKHSGEKCGTDSDDITTVKEPCTKDYCSFGCVCDSLQCNTRDAEHCGREACMFKCVCHCENWSSSGDADTPTKELETYSILNLNKHHKQNLALKEKDFSWTVVKNGSKVIICGSEKKRERKVPDRYRDSVYWRLFDEEHKQALAPAINEQLEEQLETDDLDPVSRDCMSPPHPRELERAGILSSGMSASYVRPCCVTVPWYRLPAALSVWCMVHQRYDCSCGGKDMTGLVTHASDVSVPTPCTSDGTTTSKILTHCSVTQTVDKCITPSSYISKGTGLNSTLNIQKMKEEDKQFETLKHKAKLAVAGESSSKVSVNNLKVDASGSNSSLDSIRIEGDIFSKLSTTSAASIIVPCGVVSSAAAQVCTVVSASSSRQVNLDKMHGEDKMYEAIIGRSLSRNQEDIRNNGHLGEVMKKTETEPMCNGPKCALSQESLALCKVLPECTVLDLRVGRKLSEGSRFIAGPAIHNVIKHWSHDCDHSARTCGYTRHGTTYRIVENPHKLGFDYTPPLGKCNSNATIKSVLAACQRRGYVRDTHFSSGEPKYGSEDASPVYCGNRGLQVTHVNSLSLKKRKCEDDEIHAKRIKVDESSVLDTSKNLHYSSSATREGGNHVLASSVVNPCTITGTFDNLSFSMSNTKAGATESEHSEQDTSVQDVLSGNDTRISTPSVSPVKIASSFIVRRLSAPASVTSSSEASQHLVPLASPPMMSPVDVAVRSPLAGSSSTSFFSSSERFSLTNRKLSLPEMMMAEDRRGELELDLSCNEPGEALLVAEARFRKLINMNIIGVTGLNKQSRCIIAPVESSEMLGKMRKIQTMISNRVLDVGPNMREVFFPPHQPAGAVVKPRFVMIRCDNRGSWEIVGLVQKKSPDTKLSSDGSTSFSTVSVVSQEQILVPSSCLKSTADHQIPERTSHSRVEPAIVEEVVHFTRIMSPTRQELSVPEQATDSEEDPLAMESSVNISSSVSLTSIPRPSQVRFNLVSKVNVAKVVPRAPTAKVANNVILSHSVNSNLCKPHADRFIVPTSKRFFTSDCGAATAGYVTMPLTVSSSPAVAQSAGTRLVLVPSTTSSNKVVLVPSTSASANMMFVSQATRKSEDSREPMKMVLLPTSQDSKKFVPIRLSLGQPSSLRSTAGNCTSQQLGSLGTLSNVISTRPGVVTVTASSPFAKTCPTSVISPKTAVIAPTPIIIKNSTVPFGTGAPLTSAVSSKDRITFSSNTLSDGISSQNALGGLGANENVSNVCWAAVDLSIDFKSVKLGWLQGTIKKAILNNIRLMSISAGGPVTLSVKTSNAQHITLYGMAKAQKSIEPVCLLLLGSTVMAIKEAYSRPLQYLFRPTGLKYFIRETTGELASYMYHSHAHLLKLASKKKANLVENLGIKELFPVDMFRARSKPTTLEVIDLDETVASTEVSNEINSTQCDCTKSGDFMCYGHSTKEMEAASITTARSPEFTLISKRATDFASQETDDKPNKVILHSAEDTGTSVNAADQKTITEGMSSRLQSGAVNSICTSPPGRSATLFLLSPKHSLIGPQTPSQFVSSSNVGAKFGISPMQQSNPAGLAKNDIKISTVKIIGNPKSLMNTNANVTLPKVAANVDFGNINKNSSPNHMASRSGVLISCDERVTAASSITPVAATCSTASVSEGSLASKCSSEQCEDVLVDVESSDGDTGLHSMVHQLCNEPQRVTDVEPLSLTGPQKKKFIGRDRPCPASKKRFLTSSHQQCEEGTPAGDRSPSDAVCSPPKPDVGPYLSSLSSVDADLTVTATNLSEPTEASIAAMLSNVASQLKTKVSQLTKAVAPTEGFSDAGQVSHGSPATNESPQKIKMHCSEDSHKAQLRTIPDTLQRQASPSIALSSTEVKTFERGSDSVSYKGRPLQKVVYKSLDSSSGNSMPKSECVDAVESSSITSSPRGEGSSKAQDSFSSLPSVGSSPSPVIARTAHAPPLSHGLIGLKYMWHKKKLLKKKRLVRPSPTDSRGTTHRRKRPNKRGRPVDHLSWPVVSMHDSVLLSVGSCSGGANSNEDSNGQGSAASTNTSVNAANSSDSSSLACSNPLYVNRVVSSSGGSSSSRSKDSSHNEMERQRRKEIGQLFQELQGVLQHNGDCEPPSDCKRGVWPKRMTLKMAIALLAAKRETAEQLAATDEALRAQLAERRTRLQHQLTLPGLPTALIESTEHLLAAVCPPTRVKDLELELYWMTPVKRRPDSADEEYVLDMEGSDSTCSESSGSAAAITPSTTRSVSEVGTVTLPSVGAVKGKRPGPVVLDRDKEGRQGIYEGSLQLKKRRLKGKATLHASTGHQTEGGSVLTTESRSSGTQNQVVSGNKRSCTSIGSQATPEKCHQLFGKFENTYFKGQSKISTGVYTNSLGSGVLTGSSETTSKASSGCQTATAVVPSHKLTFSTLPAEFLPNSMCNNSTLVGTLAMEQSTSLRPKLECSYNDDPFDVADRSSYSFNGVRSPVRDSVTDSAKNGKTPVASKSVNTSHVQRDPALNISRGCDGSSSDSFARIPGTPNSPVSSPSRTTVAGLHTLVSVARSQE